MNFYFRIQIIVFGKFVRIFFGFFFHFCLFLNFRVIFLNLVFDIFCREFQNSIDKISDLIFGCYFRQREQQQK